MSRMKLLALVQTIRETCFRKRSILMIMHQDFHTTTQHRPRPTNSLTDEDETKSFFIYYIRLIHRTT